MIKVNITENMTGYGDLKLQKQPRVCEYSYGFTNYQSCGYYSV